MVSPCQRMCVALLLFMAISGAAAFQIQAGSIFGSSRKLISSHSGASAARALRWRSRPCGDALLIRMRADSSEISGAYSEDSESFNPITSEELEGGDDAGVDCTSGSAHVQKCKLDLLVALAGTDRGAAAGAVQRKVMLIYSGSMIGLQEADVCTGCTGGCHRCRGARAREQAANIPCRTPLNRWPVASSLFLCSFCGVGERRRCWARFPCSVPDS